MSLDVRYLRGTQAQYDAYAKADKLVANYYYLIYPTTLGQGNPDLYIGTQKLNNQAEINAVITTVNSLGDRVGTLETDVTDLKGRLTTAESDITWLKNNAGHKFYEVTALPAFAEGHTYKEGDVCIVTVTENGVAYKTAYHCIKDAESNFAWAAMAGNYNAANVYYDKDIQVTKTVGNITTSDNKPVDLQFKGKNMEQIWQYLYATEDKSIATVQPKATFSISGNVSKEVGSTFDDPVLSITFADGTYEYGSKDANGNEYKDGVTETAGVKFNGANFYLTYDNGTTKNETLSTKSDSSNTKFSYTYDISDNNVAEGTKTWKFKADASCPASDRYPVTNLGNFVKADGTTTTDITEASGNTAAQTKTGLGEKTFTVTGWRGCFWGYKTSKALDPNNLTSAQIRALSSASNGFNATILDSKNGTGSALNKMQQIFIAAPKGKYSTVTVTNTDLGAPQTVSKVTDVQVYDATGNSNAAAYDVFYVNNDNADSKSYNYKITIA